MFTLQHASHDKEIRWRISGLIDAKQEKRVCGAALDCERLDLTC
jgi:hypothetical protein